RAQWRADESLRRGGPSFAPVSRAAVHHTVTPNDDHDPSSTVRAIHAYHVRANGWDDIGYNFLIDAAGRVYEGRWARSYQPGEPPTGESAEGLGVVGAHAEGNNAGSVGVALLGDFSRRPPTPASLDALARLLAWKADRHGIDPLGTTSWSGGRTLPTIVGHRDVGATSCPGDRLYAELPALRQSVAQRRGSPEPVDPVTGLLETVRELTGVDLPPPPRLPELPALPL
ncbi:MAG: peptidoglycan recognition protein, partial [Actinomycetota bacterium]|nr:peptidoglycan recognition protein [Actinomycetota bacterium]